MSDEQLGYSLQPQIPSRNLIADARRICAQAQHFRTTASDARGVAGARRPINSARGKSPTRVFAIFSTGKDGLPVLA